MNQITRWLVWLGRVHRSRGFGIQSPTDYAFVRYVVNEHWPYYAYEWLGGDGWLTRKLGRLYLRLANWRQPTMMVSDGWQRYWQAGCQKTRFVDDTPRVELARVDIEDREGFRRLLARCDKRSVVVVEGLWRDRQWWRDITALPEVGTTFDLYYCGIVWFDTERPKHRYVVNF